MQTLTLRLSRCNAREKDTKLCSYCRLQDETTNHISVECTFTIKLWSDLGHYCQFSFDLPILNPQSAIVDSLKLYQYCIVKSITFKPHSTIIQILNLYK